MCDIGLRLITVLEGRVFGDFCLHYHNTNLQVLQHRTFNIWSEGSYLSIVENLVTHVTLI